MSYKCEDCKEFLCQECFDKFSMLEEMEARGVVQEVNGLKVLYIPAKYMSKDATEEDKEAYNSSKDLVNTFDLSPCRAATTLDGEDLYVCKTFTSSVLNKVMKVVNIEYPVATLKRILKYKMKGYKIKTPHIEDFVVKVNEMELNSENMAYYVD